MPEISEFFGIPIYRYYREHGPPHFQVRYGGEEALVAIGRISVLEGELSPRVRGLVAEWASRHQDELLRDWRRARAHEPLEQEGRSVKKVVDAEAREDYRLWVRFEDGTEGEVDLMDLVGKGVFESWRNPREFRKVGVDPETHTVAWAATVRCGQCAERQPGGGGQSGTTTAVR